MLRTSTLVLVNSVTGYCARVWGNCSHCKLVDTQLRKAMRLITGSVMPTPLPRLSVLSQIEPPHIQKENAVLKLMARINKHFELPIHQDEIIIPRLKSFKPLLCRAEKLTNYYNNNSNRLQRK